MPVSYVFASVQQQQKCVEMFASWWTSYKKLFCCKNRMSMDFFSSFICQLAKTTLSQYFKYFAYCFSSIPLDSQSSTLIKTTQTEGRSGMV